MVALIEKEIRIKDKELKKLIKNVSMDTQISARVDSLTTEKEILAKLLLYRRQHRKSGLFVLENGLLLFAIAMFGVLAAFVFYLIPVISAIGGTWEQIGGDIAVLVLLIFMTSISIALYINHYKENIPH